MFTFARFVVGESFGPHHLVLDAGLLGRWAALFAPPPAPSATVPPGLLSVIAMRAYGNLIAPRPPGNIHAGLGFDIVRLPRPGETVATRFSCAGKEIRRERRLVHLRFDSMDADGATLFTGRFTSIVAQ